MHSLSQFVFPVPLQALRGQGWSRQWGMMENRPRTQGWNRSQGSSSDFNQARPPRQASFWVGPGVGPCPLCSKVRGTARGGGGWGRRGLVPFSHLDLSVEIVLPGPVRRSAVPGPTIKWVY